MNPIEMETRIPPLLPITRSRSPTLSTAIVTVLSLGGLSTAWSMAAHIVAGAVSAPLGPALGDSRFSPGDPHGGAVPSAGAQAREVEGGGR